MSCRETFIEILIYDLFSRWHEDVIYFDINISTILKRFPAKLGSNHVPQPLFGKSIFFRLNLWIILISILLLEQNNFQILFFIFLIRIWFPKEEETFNSFFVPNFEKVIIHPVKSFQIHCQAVVFQKCELSETFGSRCRNGHLLYVSFWILDNSMSLLPKKKLSFIKIAWQSFRI